MVRSFVYMCNQVHLQTVFVLLYSVCFSVSALSCVDVIQSFTYVLCVVIWTTLKDVVREREGITTASRMYHKNNQEPLAVARLRFLLNPYFQPATSINHLHMHIIPFSIFTPEHSPTTIPIHLSTQSVTYTLTRVHIS